MKRRRLVAAAGLAAVFVFGLVVGHLMMPPAKAPAPVAYGAVADRFDLPYDTSERAGLSPGDPTGYEQPTITPLTAPSPARMIAPPPHAHDAQALSPHGSGVASDPEIPAPSGVSDGLPTLFHSKDDVVTPLNVRDPSALVMPPMPERDPDERVETAAKPPAEAPAPVPASVQKAFGR